MRKLLGLILTISILLTQISPLSVSASDKNTGTNASDGVITIENALEGKTYTIYQMLTLESWDEEKEAYTYTISSSSSWYNFLNGYEGVTLTQRGTTDTYVVTMTGVDAAAFAKDALAYAKTNKITGISKTAEASGELVFDNLNYGYYLVDSSTGALCSLNTTDSEVKIREKNGVPTVDKEVKENSNGTYGDSNKEAIGKTIDFKTTIYVEEGAENYVLNDVMSEGLTLDKDSITVKLADGTNVAKENYEITYDQKVNHNGNEYTSTFTITFNNTYMSTLTQNIVVEYQAKLNENALIYDEANTNDTWLEYGDNHETTMDQTKTYTYKFDVVKTDQSNIVLEGAEFALYDAKTGGNKIPVVDEGNGVYRVDYTVDINDSAVIKGGKITIIGLDGDTTYYLEETKAPNGYNILTSRVELSVTDDANVEATITDNEYIEGGVQVVNTTGSRLPETGGMGTILFTTIGSIMVISFGVLLVARLRLSKES